ncbi:hypothetical protein [Pontiella agarivorans]|uniref:O-antigen ligase domain-containing protein n=1 Tax=Pontiella agarivorans TaxID=3038953 RepID=A0ABU5MSZ5_9BACT|nr:hypothetical protein [Pontiella agarivorans]MDZ8117327.1 hypothetical protein [Pontiella agarivorans]
MIIQEAKSIMLALAIMGLGLAASFFVNPIMVWGVVFVLAVGINVLGSPQTLLKTYIIWSAVSPLILLIISGPFAFIDEALVLGCVIVLVGNFTIRRQFPFKNKAMLTTLGLLYFTTFVSLVFNRSPLFPFANAILTYFSFPVVFIFAYWFRSEKLIKWFLFMAGFFLFVQIALNAGWKLGVNLLPNKHAFVGNFQDMDHGSLDSAQWVGYAMIWILILFLAMARHLQKKWRYLAYFGALISIIQFRYTFTNHAYLYLILCVGCFIVVISRNFGSIFRHASVVGLVLIAFYTLSESFDTASQENYGARTNFSKENLIFRFNKFVHAPKMQLIHKVSVEWVETNPSRWIIGMGAGNGTSSVGMARVSPGAYELLADYYLTQTGVDERHGQSIMESTYSGLVSLWSEVGIVGYLLFQILCLIPFLRVWKLVRRGSYWNRYQRILAESFVPAMLLYFISSFLTDAYYLDFWIVTMWTWAGLVYDPLPREDDPVSSDGEKISDVALAV